MFAIGKNVQLPAGRKNGRIEELFEKDKLPACGNPDP